MRLKRNFVNRFPACSLNPPPTSLKTISWSRPLRRGCKLRTKKKPLNIKLNTLRHFETVFRAGCHAVTTTCRFRTFPASNWQLLLCLPLLVYIVHHPATCVLYLGLQKQTSAHQNSCFTNHISRRSKHATSCNFLPIFWPNTVHIKNYINLLKPTGYVMHHQFNIQQLYVLPTLYLCVLYLSQNKQRLVPLTA